MTVVELTALATVAMASLSSVAIPVWLQRRKHRAEADSTAVVSWKSLTEAIQKERDDLRAQLAEIEDRARRRSREADADWDQRMLIAKQRITDLENEVAKLRDELRKFRFTKGDEQ